MMQNKAFQKPIVAPNFLVIGAMKSSTTSLCDYLGHRNNMFF